MIETQTDGKKKEQRKHWQRGVLRSKESPAAAHYSVINSYGGISSGAYESLNVGLLTGDKQENIIENRKRVHASLAVKELLFARQVHKSAIAVIQSPQDFPQNIGEDITLENGCDAMITNLTGIGLAVQHADCQAVMLFDPFHTAIAAIHCGWRGSVQNIIAATISKMETVFATNPKHLTAFISPSLGVCCAEFINYKEELPHEFYPYRQGGNHFDFKKISRRQLEECGVEKENIKSDAACTCCSPDFFSYRRAKRISSGITGRNCTVIFMP